MAVNEYEFKIYQADCEATFKFMELPEDKDTISMDKYNKVYEGSIYAETPIQALEELFKIFNGYRPKDFIGHSLSVSDVVSLNGKLYYCQNIGWQKLKGVEYS